jgi:hypothetical protein
MTIKLKPPTDKEDRSISDYWKDIARSEGEKRMQLVIDEAVLSSQLPQFKNKDFYICLFMNRHRRAKVKQSFYRVFSRISCPTPHYCMALWKYHALSGSLEFMWIVPAKPKAYYLADLYPNVPEHEKSLAYYSVCALNGTLLKIAQAENGNKQDAIIQNTAHA